MVSDATHKKLTKTSHDYEVQVKVTITSDIGLRFVSSEMTASLNKGIPRQVLFLSQEQGVGEGAARGRYGLPQWPIIRNARRNPKEEMPSSQASQDREDLLFFR
jgi:hypothetical protein